MTRFVDKETEAEIRSKVRQKWEKKKLAEEMEKIKKDEEKRLEKGSFWNQSLTYGLSEASKLFKGDNKKK